MNPLWNSLVIAGLNQDQTPFLGTVDHIGTQYESSHIATGFGLHLATPLLRDGWKADMSEAEARALLHKCMQVLFYRDCRSVNNVRLCSFISTQTIFLILFSSIQ
jgi:20S proteasome subunit beta 7